jgi:hypothetical protein
MDGNGNKWTFTIKTTGGTYINVPKSAAIAVGVTATVLLGALIGAKVIRGI